MYAERVRERERGKSEKKAGLFIPMD